MPRSRAGSRDPKYRPQYGRYDDKKVALLVTKATSQVSIQALDDHDEEASEVGVSYCVLIPVAGRTRPVLWNLSAMTLEELEATRQFFNHAFDLADPVVRERDKVARDAFNEGDDSYDRVYRRLPQFIVRERKKRENREGVQHGPQGSSGGDGSNIDLSGGVRGGGDELADGEQEQGLSEDDGPPPY